MNRKPAFLIVNADDLNLTGGVTRGVLKSHDKGIVTSTSVFVNLPVSKSLVDLLKKRKSLGLGLHLNVTLGKPISKSSEIVSLLRKDGRFKNKNGIFSSAIKEVHLYREFENQIKLFKRIFRRFPTHLDTHHQIHDDSKVFRALYKLARKYNIPFRLSKAYAGRSKAKLRRKGVYLTDYLWGSFAPERHWNTDKLCAMLSRLPSGVNEIMCHPAFIDKGLKKISSFSRGRDIELRALCSDRVIQMIKKRNISLINYGEVKTARRRTNARMPRKYLISL